MSDALTERLNQSNPWEDEPATTVQDGVTAGSISDDEEDEEDEEDEDDEMMISPSATVGDPIFQLLSDHLHEPYGPPAGGKSPPSVLQECYFKARLKQLNNLSDKSVNLELARQSRNLPESHNFYPRSLHLLKKLLGVRQAFDFEYHVCISEDFLFPRETTFPRDEKASCPKCGKPRFVRDSRGVLKPQRVFWYFGLRKTVMSFFSDPLWCKLRREGPQNAEPFEFRSQPEFERLRQATGDLLLDPENGHYQIGFDFGQMFSFKTHSCGVLGIRYVPKLFWRLAGCNAMLS